ncbi:MAG: spermidine synthase, partial [Gammaproteobacteria bacterium]
MVSLVAAAHVVQQFGFKQTDIAEISPGVAAAAGEYFGHINDSVLQREKVKLHVDDGRHFLLQTDARYDLITIEISSVWFNGATNSYSTDFFTLAAAKLETGGVLQQWLQIHHLSPREIATVIASIHAVFPHIEFWVHGGQGILVASREPLQISSDLVRRATTVPAIRRLDAGFIDRVLGSRLLDSAAVDRLAESISRAGIVPN